MYTIVGIDPGKTSAIVSLDLSGRIIARMHKRFAGIEYMISEIKKRGTPVVIASDKPEVSEAVKRINAAFNATLFAPERELKITYKREMIREIGIRDPHERDAYVAAMKAYRAYANKLKQAERIAAERKIEDVDEIKAKVVAKYSIDEAIEKREANRR